MTFWAFLTKILFDNFFKCLAILYWPKTCVTSKKFYWLILTFWAFLTKVLFQNFYKCFGHFVTSENMRNLKQILLINLDDQSIFVVTFFFKIFTSVLAILFGVETWVTSKRFQWQILTFWAFLTKVFFQNFYKCFDHFVWGENMCNLKKIPVINLNILSNLDTNFCFKSVLAILYGVKTCVTSKKFYW